MSSFRNFIDSMPPVTKHLITINIIVWLATVLFPSTTVDTMMRYGALHYIEAPDFNAIQLVTYMFMHSPHGFTHILFNMFALFMFGSIIERTVGGKRFLSFYMTCGVGAAIVQQIVWAFTLPDIISDSLAAINGVSTEMMTQYLNMNPQAWAQNFNVFTTVGASGAIFGILLAFGMMYPNAPLYIFFIPIPFKAKWVVLVYGIIEILLGLSMAKDGVAHFAHLGGMLFGFFYIMYWKKKFGSRGGNVY